MTKHRNIVKRQKKMREEIIFLSYFCVKTLTYIAAQESRSLDFFESLKGNEKELGDTIRGMYQRVVDDMKAESSNADDPSLRVRADG